MRFKLFIFALLALLVANCTLEDPFNPVEEKGGKRVTISADIPQETRVSYNDATLKLAWESNDQLLLVGFDNDNTYKGHSTFTWTGTGNSFNGDIVTDATKYKAYYPANAVKLDEYGEVILDANGNVPVPGYEFWEQTQVGDNSTTHINQHLFMSDEVANALTTTFNLLPKSSIIKFVFSGIPGNFCLTKILWKTEESLNGYTHWAALNVSGVTFAAGTSNNSLTAYLAFNPDDMIIGVTGRSKIMLVGLEKSYEWISGQRTTVKTYEAGKLHRYRGHRSDARSEFTFAINPRIQPTDMLKML